MLQKLNKAFCGCVNDREPELAEFNEEFTTNKPSVAPDRRDQAVVCMDPSVGFNSRMPLTHSTPVNSHYKLHTPVNGSALKNVHHHPVYTTDGTPIPSNRAALPNGDALNAQKQYQLVQRRRQKSSTTSRSPADPIMSYSAADLDDPGGSEWSAYNPQNGVAWAPQRTHSHKDPDSSSFRKFRSVGSIQSLRSGRSKMSFSRSVTSLTSASSTWNHALRHSNKRETYRCDSVDGDVILRNRDVPGPPPSQRAAIGTCNTTTPTRRRRCYTEGSSGAQTPRQRIRTRSRSRSRAASRESISKLDKSWASFDEYNWDTSVLVLDEPDDVFSDGEDAEYLTENFEDTRDDLDYLDLESRSGLDDTTGYATEDSVEDYKLKHILGEHDLAHLFIARRNLRTGRLLMRGDHHCVCCGCLVTGQYRYSAYMRPVSVQIYKGVNSDEDQVSFLRNVSLMRQLRHPNVLEVLGVCLEGSPMTRDGIEMLLVTEKSHFQVSLHRLLCWVGENNRELLSRRCASQFALQICYGLQYLKDKRILHTNLTSATVLLSGSCEVKLSNIEPYPISNRNSDYEWMAIESLREGSHSFKSIVWSFGVVLWEIVSVGMQPYVNLRNCQEVFIYLSTGRRLLRPSSGSYRLYNMMYQCWNPHPRQRPSIRQLISALTRYQQTLPQSRPAKQLFPDREDFWKVLRDYI